MNEKLMVMFLNVRADSGISFIEIILVIAIVSVFAFGLIPQFF